MAYSSVFRSSQDCSNWVFSGAGSIDDHRSKKRGRGGCACISRQPLYLILVLKLNRAFATTTAELRWFYHLFRKPIIPIRSTPCIFVANVSTLPKTANPIFHARTHHIEIDHHFIREFACSRSSCYSVYPISPPNGWCLHQRSFAWIVLFPFLTLKLNLHFLPIRLSDPRAGGGKSTINLDHSADK